MLGETTPFRFTVINGVNGQKSRHKQSFIDGADRVDEGTELDRLPRGFSHVLAKKEKAVLLRLGCEAV